MRAVTLVEPGRLEVTEMADPAGTGLVQVRIEQASICGTDRHVVAGATRVDLPRVIGHELVGRVAGGDLSPALGADPLSIGQRVLVDPATYCGRCPTCRRGLENLCPFGGLMGRDVDGGLAELVAVPPARLHPIPEKVGVNEAAVCQVLGTCVHAQRRLGVFPGQAGVVVGLGVAGLLHLQLLVARGVAPVIGVSRRPEKRALAKELGADVVCSTDEARQVVADATGGQGAGVVVEAVGSPQTVALAVEVAGPGATMVLFGTVAGPPQPIPFYALYHAEINLLNPRAALGVDYDDAIALVANGAVTAGPIVTDRLPMDQAPAVLADWARPGRLKVVFEP